MFDGLALGAGIGLGLVFSAAGGLVDGGGGGWILKLAGDLPFEN